MDQQFERVRSSLQAVVREIRREDVTFMAASIAYHAFVSMLPILLLVMLVVSAFGSEQLDATAVNIIKTVLPATAQEAVTNALTDATASVGVSVIGVGVLLWGTSKIFRAMDAAFAEIYDTERELSILDQSRDALLVLLALAVATIGTIVLGSFVEFPATVPFARALNGVLAVLGLTIALFPIYYVFPNIAVSLREVLPGVLVTAIGWLGLKWLFNLYVSFSSKPDVFGLIGTIVLLVTWLYLGSLVLLVGAAVNATLAGRGRTSKRERKRRFGKQVTDAESFDERLTELRSKATDADIPEEMIRSTLRRQAATVGTTRGEQSTTAAETESESEQG